LPVEKKHLALFLSQKYVYASDSYNYKILVSFIF